MRDVQITFVLGVGLPAPEGRGEGVAVPELAVLRSACGRAAFVAHGLAQTRVHAVLRGDALLLDLGVTPARLRRRVVAFVEGRDAVHIALAVRLDAAALRPAHGRLDDHGVVDVAVETVVRVRPHGGGSVGPRVGQGVHVLMLGFVLHELRLLFGQPVEHVVRGPVVALSPIVRVLPSVVSVQIVLEVHAAFECPGPFDVLHVVCLIFDFEQSVFDVVERLLDQVSE